MSLNAYQFFVTVVEQGTFAKASEVLNVTPSAISHAVAKLEDEFGYSLLTRNKSGINLTSYGETLLPTIRQVLNSERVLKQRVDALNGLEKGLVKIGCFSSICTTYLPRVIQDFQKIYPGIEVQILQGTYSDVIRWMKNGEIEMGWLSRESVKGDLPFNPLFKDELLCVVPKGFEVNQEGYISQEEIEGEAFITQSEATDSDIQKYLENHRIKVKTMAYVSDDLSAVSLVGNHMGISIIPELVIHGMSFDIDMYSLNPQGYREIGITAYIEKLSPAAKKLYIFSKEWFEENQKTL